MNELTKLSINYELPKVTYDLSNVKSQVAELKSKYSGLVLSEDDISEIKKEMATINKIKKTIADSRIELVKKISQPISEFDTEVKGIEKELVETYNSLKEQVNYFDELEKEAKKEEIQKLVNEFPNIYIEWPERWFNKSTSLTVIKNDIANQAHYYNEDLATVNDFCSVHNLSTDKYEKMLQSGISRTDVCNRIKEDAELLKSVEKEKEVPVFNGKTTKRYIIVGEDWKHEALLEYAEKLKMIVSEEK